MNPKNGIIGLFVMIFFASTIGLVTLLIDDQKDLSSRAATGIATNLRTALPGEKMIENDSVWQGKIEDKTVTIHYDKVIWTPPRQNIPVFFHHLQPITVRVVPSITPLVISQVLGEDFQSPKNLGAVNTSLTGWTVQSFSYDFFGQPKVVDLWFGPSDVNLIVVMPDDSGRTDVENLASQIVIGAAKVKGAVTVDESARLAALVRPSVVMILNNYCADLSFNQKSYPFCVAQTGSGFFVNKDGYLATNGHVVTNDPEPSLFYGIESGSLDTFLVDFFNYFLTVQTGIAPDRNAVEQKVRDAHKNKESIYQMAALAQDLYRKKLVNIAKSENRYYVQLGNSPIQLSKSGVNTGEDIVTATFVDADYKEPDLKVGFTSSDVALLKVEGTNFPAIPLGSIEDIDVGSEILVVGFPGVVMGSNSLLLDTSANAQPTFTRGVVSSFKQAKGNQKNLIQTDASINHGNSGGPAVTSGGKVVGIATYGLIPEEGGGNYNFLRDVADLKELMKKNNVSEDAGETFPVWKDGLNNFWVSYYKTANSKFEKVAALYPNHPTVVKYTNEARSKIGSPEDLTPSLTHDQRRMFMNIAGAMMVFSLIVITILGVSSYIDNKRRQSPVTLPPRNPLPPQAVQTF